MLKDSLGDRMKAYELVSDSHLVKRVPVIIRLDGKGMPHLQRRGFGDMMVKVIVKTPKRLSKRAKELLEELKKEIE